MNIKNHCRKIVLFVINHFMSGNYLWKTKNKLLRLFGVSIGENVKIVGPLKIDVCSNLKIGDNCWIGRNLTVMGNSDVVIGDNCDLAPDVYFVTGTHEIGDFKRRAGKGYCQPINVGHGCWIGVKAILLAGVNLGDGCVVAAGSVVNKSVENNLLVGGIPARTLKKLG